MAQKTAGVQIPDGRTELDKRIVQAKRGLEQLMIQFNTIIQDKTLPENKSQGKQKEESDYVMRLLIAANELDTVNPPEGTFGLITLLIREGFIMRDNNNKLEHRLQELTKEIGRLKIMITDRNRAG